MSAAPVEKQIERHTRAIAPHIAFIQAGVDTIYPYLYEDHANIFPVSPSQQLQVIKRMGDSALRIDLNAGKTTITYLQALRSEIQGPPQLTEITTLINRGLPDERAIEYTQQFERLKHKLTSQITYDLGNLKLSLRFGHSKVTNSVQKPDSAVAWIHDFVTDNGKTVLIEGQPINLSLEPEKGPALSQPMIEHFNLRNGIGYMALNLNKRIDRNGILLSGTHTRVNANGFQTFEPIYIPFRLISSLNLLRTATTGMKAMEATVLPAGKRITL